MPPSSLDPAKTTFNITIMPSIPIDVLLEILKHVRKADLATLCRVNKICCSYSRDILYRDIWGEEKVIQTLVRSIDVARRVHSFGTSWEHTGLATALQNMSSLRSLYLENVDDDSVLDGCTFKLEKFTCSFTCSESLRNFFISQPNLTDVKFPDDPDHSESPSVSYPLEETCLPNLTRVSADPPLLRILIPGRPVREVTTLSLLDIDAIDLSFFTLSTTPIEKLWINLHMLYPKPVSLLVSIFPCLEYLWLQGYDLRVPLCWSI
jgi:hypothetical protein